MEPKLDASKIVKYSEEIFGNAFIKKTELEKFKASLRIFHELTDLKIDCINKDSELVEKKIEVIILGIDYANELIFKIDSLDNSEKRKKTTLKKRLNQLIDSLNKQLLTLQHKNSLLINGNQRLIK